MAEEPSSEAQGSLEKVEVEAEKSLPLLPPSETPPPKSESASLPAVTCSPPPSSDPAPSSSSSPVKAVEVEDSAPKIVAASPATAEESTESPNDGGDDGGGKRRSPSPVPAGAATPPSGNPSASGPVVAVPVDAMRLVAVPYFIAPAALLENSGFASHFAITHQAVLATVTAQAQMQLRAGNVPPPAISPISVAPPKQEKPSAPSEENLLSPDGDQEQHPSGSKTESPHPGPMKTPGDGYNWRKYGQKQVKGTENARSYYRCTHASCPAKKKVEHRQDGHVLEVIYRGGHNHQPPQKSRFSKDKRPLPLLTSGDAEFSTPGSAKAARAEPSPLKSEPPSLQGNGIDKRLHCSSDCEADGDAKARRNQEEEPELKRRAVERAKASPTNPLAIVIKTAREPKIIRHLISDPGSMSDGYRWRKYGQKFVKGNPNPRSYYRCTHVGCPARKHVEKDSTDDGAVIINYEGNHNHGLPPPKTPASAASAAACPPPATDLLVAAAAAIEAGGHATPRQASPPAGAEQLPSEPATDGSLESAQTLLSIGGARPLFDDHRPAVSVQNS